MSGPIQTIPQGLLGLLQLKQAGRNPDQLSETVAPTVDMLTLWLNRQNVDLSINVIGGASTRNQPTATPGEFVFSVLPIVVPPGQTWWITDYTVKATLAAAETLVFAPAILGGLFFNSMLAAPVNDIITARARFVSCFARNFWLLPGQGLGYFCFDSVTAGNIVVTGTIRGVVIPI